MADDSNLRESRYFRIRNDCFIGKLFSERTKPAAEYYRHLGRLAITP
jgi:hypothetical protein